MKVLLDTHALLWLVQGSERLSQRARDIFLDERNELFFSAASYWELCIKQALGKLGLSSGWQERLDLEMSANGVAWLEIKKAHCQGLLHLPPHHGDPFDRLLVSQAIAENMAVLSADVNMRRYSITALW